MYQKLCRAFSGNWLADSNELLNYSAPIIDWLPRQLLKGDDRPYWFVFLEHCLCDLSTWYTLLVQTGTLCLQILDAVLLQGFRNTHFAPQLCAAILAGNHLSATTKITPLWALSLCPGRQINAGYYHLFLPVQCIESFYAHPLGGPKKQVVMCYFDLSNRSSLPPFMGYPLPHWLAEPIASWKIF